MEFDFYSKYLQLDTEHLLTLVATPHKMQAAAMEAALKVLAERGVTELEIEAHKATSQAVVTAAEQRREERKQSGFLAYLEKTFFDQGLSWDFEEEPISLSFTSEERRDVIRKLLMLLMAPALQTIVVFVGIVSLFLIAIEHSTFNDVIFFNLLAMLISLSIVVSISWFLLKRKKSAWSIMLIYTVYNVANNIFRVYQLTDVGFDYVSTYQLVLYWVMTPLGAYTILLLNKKIILRAFELSRKRIENTWAIAIIFPVIIFFMLYLYS